MGADASRYGGRKISLSALAAWGTACDEFTKGNASEDLFGRLRSTFMATARLTADGIEISMTGSSGEFGHVQINYADLCDQEHNFTPANVKGLLADFSRKLSIQASIPSGIVIPKHFTGI